MVSMEMYNFDRRPLAIIIRKLDIHGFLWSITEIGANDLCDSMWDKYALNSCHLGNILESLWNHWVTLGVPPAKIVQQSRGEAYNQIFGRGVGVAQSCEK